MFICVQAETLWNTLCVLSYHAAREKRSDIDFRNYGKFIQMICILICTVDGNLDTVFARFYKKTLTLLRFHSDCESLRAAIVCVYVIAMIKQ